MGLITTFNQIILNWNLLKQLCGISFWFIIPEIKNFWTQAKFLKEIFCYILSWEKFLKNRIVFMWFVYVSKWMEWRSPQIERWGILCKFVFEKGYKNSEKMVSSKHLFHSLYWVHIPQQQSEWKYFFLHLKISNHGKVIFIFSYIHIFIFSHFFFWKHTSIIKRLNN